MRPSEARSPTTPLKRAGMRTDPPMSLPWAIGPMPVAMAAPAPPLEPPGETHGSRGFSVRPCSALSAKMRIVVARPIGAQLMAVQGPLTRSVRDARLALNVMARGDPCDTRWADVPLDGPPLPRPIRVALVQ